VTPQTKNLVLLAIATLSVAFWLLAAVTTVLLLNEVNSNLRPKRLNLLRALSVSDVSSQGRLYQRCVTIGIRGFLGGLLLCILAKAIL